MEVDQERVIPRLFDNVELPDVCFDWQRAKSSFGHGRIKIDGKLHSPHRVVYQFFNGPIPEGEMVLHHCDNPACVNPRHLFVGSNSDNMKDAAAKGRLPVQTDPSRWQGTRHPNAKLNDEKVREIRAAVASGEPKKIVAKRYDIHHSIVQKIIKGQRWSHVQ